MKTLSEHKTEREAADQNALQAWLTECQTLLDSIPDDLEPFSQTEPRIIRAEDSERHRQKLRERLASGEKRWFFGRTEPYGVACDHCGTELVLPDSNAYLPTHPPKREIGCPGCGWRGYVRK